MAETAAAPGWTPLPPAYDARAATLLADCPALGSIDAAREAIAALRAEPEGELHGWVEDGALVAVYGLRKVGMSFEMPWLAVAPDRRGERFGRSALMDALRHCGRRPMTVVTGEGLKGWFERVGFKTVGRKPLPAGGYTYRLGWYAPRRPGEPGYGAH